METIALVLNTKTCPKCKQDKPTSEFYLDPYSRDGLSVYCKRCKVLKNKDYKNRRTLESVERIGAVIDQLLELNQQQLRGIK